MSIYCKAIYRIGARSHSNKTHYVFTIMKHLPLFKLLIFSLTLTYVTYIPAHLTAQTPNQPEVEMDGTNVDNLPNDPQQMTTWRCNQEDKEIVVEVKDVDIWQKMLKNEGWQCQETLSVIPSGQEKFSCTPSKDIGILTIFWVKGQGEKEQMKAWLDELRKNPGMVCYISSSNQFWE